MMIAPYKKRVNISRLLIMSALPALTTVEITYNRFQSEEFKSRFYFEYGLRLSVITRNQVYNLSYKPFRVIEETSAVTRFRVIISEMRSDKVAPSIRDG